MEPRRARTESVILTTENAEHTEKQVVPFVVSIFSVAKTSSIVACSVALAFMVEGC